MGSVIQVLSSLRLSSTGGPPGADGTPLVADPIDVMVTYSGLDLDLDGSANGHCQFHADCKPVAQTQPETHSKEFLGRASTPDSGI